MELNKNGNVTDDLSNTSLNVLNLTTESRSCEYQFADASLSTG